MRGVYGHVSPAMRAELKAAMQERWDASLRERARFSPRSIVPVLDALLVAERDASANIGSLSHGSCHTAPASLPKLDTVQDTR
jgi:hypothetical protein